MKKYVVELCRHSWTISLQLDPAHKRSGSRKSTVCSSATSCRDKIPPFAFSSRGCKLNCKQSWRCPTCNLTLKSVVWSSMNYWYPCFGFFKLFFICGFFVNVTRIRSDGEININTCQKNNNIFHIFFIRFRFQEYRCKTGIAIFACRSLEITAITALHGVNNFYISRFGVLESQAFIGRKRVRTIYLNASEITELGPRTLNGLVELEILHLENNLLHSIGSSQFSNLTNLRFNIFVKQIFFLINHPCSNTTKVGYFR